ncbi:MAG: hypothetical protein IT373_30230 [Polyangiaceae bacterium]|nr:hypothetical protein [Polyangiaceae bacterium]
MATCAKCGTEIDAARALLSPQGMVCEQCHYAEASSAGGGTYGKGAGGLGVVLGVVPFFLHYGSVQTTTVNGVTTVSGQDFVALGGGGGALLLGLVGVVAGLRAKSMPTVGIAAAALALGVVQLLRGLLIF